MGFDIHYNDDTGSSADNTSAKNNANALPPDIKRANRGFSKMSGALLSRNYHVYENPIVRVMMFVARRTRSLAFTSTPPCGSVAAFRSR